MPSLKESKTRLIPPRKYPSFSSCLVLCRWNALRWYDRAHCFGLLIQTGSRGALFIGYLAAAVLLIGEHAGTRTNLTCCHAQREPRVDTFFGKAGKRTSADITHFDA
jgi:hypothetical protein